MKDKVDQLLAGNPAMKEIEACYQEAHRKEVINSFGDFLRQNLATCEDMTEAFNVLWDVRTMLNDIQKEKVKELEAKYD